MRKVALREHPGHKGKDVGCGPRGDVRVE
jgi:hypothetical protein